MITVKENAYSSTAIKSRSMVNYCQSLAFNCQRLSCNDHCDQWNLFYQYHFYFLEFLLNYLELVFLQFKHIYKPQRTSLFPFYLFIFYLMFHNHSVYSCFPPFRTFPLRVNTQDECVLFLIVVCNHSM